MKPWNSMTPRERDALIAEKVMGWRKVNNLFEWPAKDSWIHIYDIPNFSTDIAAAWKVVEKLCSQFNIVLECVSFEYNCHVNIPADLGSRVHARASSAQEAICLAALKVVGVELE